MDDLNGLPRAHGAGLADPVPVASSIHHVGDCTCSSAGMDTRCVVAVRHSQPLSEDDRDKIVRDYSARYLPQPATRKELAEDAIREYQKRLGLQTWDIRFDPKPLKGDGFSATCEMRVSTRVAVIRLHPDVPDDFIPADVVHELAHLVLKDYTMLTSHVLAKHGDTALGVLDMLGDMEERICEVVSFSLTGLRFAPIGKHERKCYAVFDEETA